MLVADFKMSIPMDEYLNNCLLRFRKHRLAYVDFRAGLALKPEE